MYTKVDHNLLCLLTLKERLVSTVFIHIKHKLLVKSKITDTCYKSIRLTNLEICAHSIFHFIFLSIIMLSLGLPKYISLRHFVKFHLSDVHPFHQTNFILFKSFLSFITLANVGVAVYFENAPCIDKSKYLLNCQSRLGPLDFCSTRGKSLFILSLTLLLSRHNSFYSIKTRGRAKFFYNES